MQKFFATRDERMKDIQKEIVYRLCVLKFVLGYVSAVDI